MLLDCGATTLSALKRASVAADAIDSVFISHLHGDHFAGLPFLFLEYTYAAPRRRPLRIAGPPGTEERLQQLYRAMYRDASRRPLPFEIEYSILWPGRRSEIGAATVEPFRVPHQEDDISLGLQLRVAGRSILYSGDTGWTEELVHRSQGIDLFVCECSFYETRMSTHLDYPRLAEHRERFGARRMVLTHLGREVLARRSQIDIELAFDGMRIEIE